ncbi:COG0863 DNA modification methylase [uncultured Caudovirales phage]|uniref:COG0863 DNA modification methylase n=1 Tax=uncultured Caudovirales phage TaxID=2100421 RepID=A0A6J7XH37_9CAUD|nr:COG0863 DNA modification methylase [uncultured Caudovirales phage]CAB4192436.1 COG0863 DNA modification methylase [uncultured Caudovirales phage]CAB4216331.1 COG0863 DNA modification methylase [uncultured Caudovirales phage]CAB5230509.1 COG0863 DNA modification methylase [uncultured Caudovirales phage]
MKYETVTVASLMLDPANVRKHDHKNIDAIKASYARFGQQKPIVVDGDGIVRDGNGQLMAAKALGMASLAIVRTDLKGAEATAYAIAANRTAELANWDDEALASQLAGIQIDDEELANIAGFTDAEISELVMAGRDIAEDEVPEPPAVPITKAGDLWLLGTHRVLCGDSTNADDVARLMDGSKAQMMFTDPPYGVNYEGGHFHSGDVSIVRKREKLEADSTADIYSAFLPVAFKFVDGACYIWFAGSKSLEVYSALKENNYEIHSLLIWNKTNAKYAAMNSQYKLRHEPFIYCKPKGSTLRWCGATTEATVWDEARDGINEFHPTQKPVALAAKAIRNHEAESVLDLFLGSGSTLIAAEQLNRKCYGMEISPAYCDVIVKRWEKLTNKKATLA